MHHQLVLVLRSTLRSEITLIPVAVQRTPQAIQILKLILICSKAEMVLPTFQLMAENGTSKDREKLMSTKRTAATTRQQATIPSPNPTSTVSASPFPSNLPTGFPTQEEMENFFEKLREYLRELFSKLF